METKTFFSLYRRGAIASSTLLCHEHMPRQFFFLWNLQLGPLANSPPNPFNTKCYSGNEKEWGPSTWFSTAVWVTWSCTVYDKVNNIKVLRGNENLAVRRPRQLKANPLNNMLQVPAALNEMHFFIRKLSLIVVTMTPSLKHNTAFSMFS